MKHQQLFYILKFQGLNLIKVGITTDLRSRIATFREVYQNPFDLENSHVVTSADYPVKEMEREALLMLRRLSLEDIPFQNRIDGYTEIRDDSNIMELLKIFRNKGEVFGFNIVIYTGIDYSGFRSEIIPREYYPSEVQADVILDDLNSKIMQLADERGVPFFQVVNEIIYKHFENTDMVVSRKQKEESNEYFLVPHKAFVREVG